MFRLEIRFCLSVTIDLLISLRGLFCTLNIKTKRSVTLTVTPL